MTIRFAGYQDVGVFLDRQLLEVVLAFRVEAARDGDVAGVLRTDTGECQQQRPPKE